jgi:hypothetical protein
MVLGDSDAWPLNALDPYYITWGMGNTISLMIRIKTVEQLSEIDKQKVALQLPGPCAMGVTNDSRK